MKRALIALCAVSLLAACEVKKTGEDTYKVESPEVNTQKVETAVDNAANKTETALDNAAQKTETAAKELAADAKEAGRDAAKATGTALEKAGKKLQEHAKPGDQ